MIPISDRLINTVITVNVFFTFCITNCGLRYKVFVNLLNLSKDNLAKIRFIYWFISPEEGINAYFNGGFRKKNPAGDRELVKHLHTANNQLINRNF